MFSKKTKILKIKYPILRCYPHHANIIACLSTNDFDLDDVMSNYIQLIYNSDIKRIDFNCGIDILNFIKNYPHVDSFNYKRTIIKSQWGSYSNFVKSMIDNDCYVHLLIDMYYISAYKHKYDREHYPHNITIYGYDDNCFYVADSFVNGRYEFAKIPIHEIDEAELDPSMHEWLDGVHCWELKEGMYKCLELSSAEVRKAIYSYINSERSTGVCYHEDKRRGKRGHPFYYGLSIYNEIIKYVETTDDSLDLLIPYVLIEQKRALQYICNRLDIQYRIKDCEKNIRNLLFLETECQRILNLFLKYNHSQNKYTKNEIISCMIRERKFEATLLRELYNDISLCSLFKKAPPIPSALKYNLTIDESTQGSWIDHYGRKGYYIIGDRVNLPDGVFLKTNNCKYISLIRSNADLRGLCKSDESGRLAAYYLHSREFDIVITISERTTISLYLLDYDRLHRKERVIVQLKRSGEIVVSEIFDQFENGIYVTFEADEDIVISFKKIAGPDATISAIFFD